MELLSFKLTFNILITKTDQESLKYLLENNIYYEICYKKGAYNKVAYALSSTTHAQLIQIAISVAQISAKHCVHCLIFAKGHVLAYTFISYFC